MDTVAQTLAAGVRLSSPSQVLHHAALPCLRAAFAGVQRHWQQASTRRSLAGLDDAALRDLGMTRAEIGSVAAEAHEAVVCTRMRTVGRAAAEGWS
jgi:uncharacterized protein YjiS (DUF1127 family)